jgi:uracil-DNA glycosylase family 4
VAKLSKPPACAGCPLAERGNGYVPGEGPPGSPLAFIAESAGIVEALTGRPLVGDAGGMFTRLLTMLGWKREALRLDNTIRCQPPGDWFDERAPWYYQAMAHCQYSEQETLAAGSKVVVTMGGTALRRVMHYEHHKNINIQNFHGAILRDPTDRFWVVPTYHPSFLQRGATNLIGTVLWDLRQAEIARDTGKPEDPGQLIIDPPLEWFRAWVDQVVAARQQDPASYPISSDVETPDKAGGKTEGELTNEDRSFQIIRQNFSCHPDEGVTVPEAEAYRDEVKRLYASPGDIWQWNREYDFIRLVNAGHLREEDSLRVVDLMWYAKVLQSDVPLGLGFWAPFYSTFGPWKHKAQSDPGFYGAADGMQNHRIGFGLIKDLIAMGQYRIAERHTHRLKTRVLRPAQLVGVKINRQRLQIFKEQLGEKARTAVLVIQNVVPESICPLTPKGGLVSKPLDNVLHVKASAFTRKGKVRAGRPVSDVKQELYAKARVIERLTIKEVWTCATCGAVDVPKRHKCEGSAGRPRQSAQGAGGDPGGADPAGGGAPQLVLAPATVTRYFWQEPFNPDSWQQVLAYIKARKHKPGRSKKSKGGESTDRETLLRLARTTQDPFYAALLDYRAVVKVKGTYVEGTERRLDEHDRLHPVPTFRPSTMRLSYVDPNITNVVADKGGQEGLAAGFRRCVVADQVVPEWAPPADRAAAVVGATRLLEVDFSAIEGVQTGWCARDPFLMRIARLGIHSYLISQRLKDAPDLSAPDADIAKHLKMIKKKAGALLYDQVKHTVYGVLYGQTPIGLQYTWPHLYPTQKSAVDMVEFMFSYFPSVRIFQQVVMDTAARQHYLGGSDPYRFQAPGLGIAGSVEGHPFQYKHWFWSVYAYKRLTRTQELRLLSMAQRAGVAAPITYINGIPFRLSRGGDANRTIALYPQSIAAGDLKEAELRLLADPDDPSYIGDAYYGRTPLRAPIHDSMLFEVPFRSWDRVCEKVALEMRRPISEQPLLPEWGIGTHLSIGVAAKMGENWQDTEDLAGSLWSGDLVDEQLSPLEAEDQEDFEDLQRAVS